MLLSKVCFTNSSEWNCASRGSIADTLTTDRKRNLLIVSTVTVPATAAIVSATAIPEGEPYATSLFRDEWWRK